jgi:hypothetical protein
MEPLPRRTFLGQSVSIQGTLYRRETHSHSFIEEGLMDDFSRAFQSSPLLDYLINESPWELLGMVFGL